MSAISMWFTAPDFDAAAERAASGIDPADESVLDPALSTMGIDWLAEVWDADVDRHVVDVDDAVIGSVPAALVAQLANLDSNVLTELALECEGDELAGVFDATDAAELLTECAAFCRAHGTSPVFWLLIP